MDKLTVNEMIDAIKKNYPPPQYSMLLEALGHAVELMKAEAEGRLVVLPCKIGDLVWFVLQDVDEDSRWEVSEPEKITEVGASGFWISGLRDDPDGKHDFIPWSNLGVEAFLSREAAEAALKEREDAHQMASTL